MADQLESGGEATLARVDVECGEGSAFGVVVADDCGRITGFTDKPARPEPRAGPCSRTPISTGICAFDTATLLRELREDAASASSQHGFGHDILPRMLERGVHVHAHDFERSCVRQEGAPGYWRDVGAPDA